MSLPRSVNPTIWQFRTRAHVLCAQGKAVAGLAGLNWLHENTIMVNANLQSANLTHADLEGANPLGRTVTNPRFCSSRSLPPDPPRNHRSGYPTAMALLAGSSLGLCQNSDHGSPTGLKRPTPAGTYAANSAISVDHLAVKTVLFSAAVMPWWFESVIRR
jgi:hypothetical protein